MGPMTEAEVKEYMQQLREKSQEYNALRSKLLALSDETKVLENTKRIICDGNPEMLSKKQELEEANVDPEDERKKLQDLATQKANLNENKQLTLDETALVVKEIDEKLKANKSKLQPLMKQLKIKRNEIMEVEETYVEKKGIYDDHCLQLNVKTNQLRDELEGIEN